MASSRRTILRQPLDRGEFRQRSDSNNVFIDKIMEGYTPFLLGLVRQQRLILKSKEADEDILFGCFFRIVMGIHSDVLIGVMQGDLAKRYYANKEAKQILDLLLEEPANGSKRPGIYCNSIGRISDGSALSRNESIIIIDKMQAYIDNSDHESILDIDCIKGVWKQPYQRYLEKPVWRV